MYKQRPGIVNGAIINDLLRLCNENFINPMVQPYAGANRECMFCGTTEDKNGGTHHSVADCPVMKFKDIMERNNNLFYKDGEKDKEQPWSCPKCGKDARHCANDCEVK